MLTIEQMFDKLKELSGKSIYLDHLTSYGPELEGWENREEFEMFRNLHAESFHAGATRFCDIYIQPSGDEYERHYYVYKKGKEVYTIYKYIITGRTLDGTQFGVFEGFPKFADISELNRRAPLKALF